MNKKIIGLVFIGIAIIISISNFSINGAFIGALPVNLFSLIAIAFFVGGIGLLMARKSAQEILDSGAYVSSTRRLKRIAKDEGYDLEDGYREGTRVYDGKTVLTVIPNGKEVHGTGTQKSILEALASGISSFRKRNNS